MPLSDQALHALLRDHPARGWRSFVDQYTPTLAALIERAGVTDRDDQTDVYVRICERLADQGCARLRQHDPSKGPLAAWLTIAVRHAVVDWVRSRTGRRRLFGAVDELDETDRRVFELYYWERYRPTEIAGLLSHTRPLPVSLADVFDALARIERVLSDRHRADLLALQARSEPPAPLDEHADAAALTLADRQIDPETALHARRLDAAVAEALRALPSEDAAIIRLMFVRGWSLTRVRRALHVADLSRDRLRQILVRLRSALEARGVGSGEAATPGLAFLDDEAP